MRMIVSLAALALIVPAAATAAPPESAPQMRVSYVGLDLRQPQGVQVLLRRVKGAAATVCSQSPWNVGTDINSIERYDRCYRQAVRQAVSEMNNPALTLAAGLAPKAPVET